MAPLRHAQQIGLPVRTLAAIVADTAQQRIGVDHADKPVVTRAVRIKTHARHQRSELPIVVTITIARGSDNLDRVSMLQDPGHFPYEDGKYSQALDFSPHLAI
jgi:hypothetical protein